MSESWIMIALGVFLIVGAFLTTGVSNKAWRGGTFSPPTKKLRVSMFLIGVLSLVVGIGGLLR